MDHNMHAMAARAPHDLDMGSPTMDMGMPIQTSDASAHHDMDEMTMSMADMIMGFFTSTHTPLYSPAWAPSGAGAYAATCIFLIVLAALLRVLLALRPILERRIWRTPSIHTDMDNDPSLLHDQKIAHPSPSQVLSNVSRDVSTGWAGWRVAPAVARATYEVVVVGVGYLLMLAVMTMNVGYFLSVLGGAWLGTFLLGDLAAHQQPAHC
ncbi:Ctr copper transporter family-domain-containing protein [Stachybotrys elegans]|uniref:Copper transport protein n=1 Tax=Stachybotrys elegans TaxID=80388 RepID=A0A8K0SGC1_9HYPO|nr:Ctr copper transporter family-domain-containing protein [Stachybotrys elegans]